MISFCLPYACREKVKNLLDSFLKEVSTMSDDFFKEAPYNHEITTEDAIAFIEKSKQDVSAICSALN